MPALDTIGRPMRDLRISVTDRCNFRCTYCMPFDEYQWIERQEVLSFEEIERFVRVTHRLIDGLPAHARRVHAG